MDFRCRRCGCAVLRGQGYCAPCADYVDGYESGAHYCDHFEGTTPESAALYAEQMETPSNIVCVDVYRAGLLAGLTEAAKVNVEAQAEE